MSYDIIPDRSDGQVITQEWFNVILRALSADIGPRNSSGVITDLSGNLGTSTYRWNALIAKSLLLMGPNALTWQSGVMASALTATLPTALPASGKKYPLKIAA